MWNKGTQQELRLENTSCGQLDTIITPQGLKSPFSRVKLLRDLIINEWSLIFEYTLRSLLRELRRIGEVYLAGETLHILSLSPHTECRNLHCGATSKAVDMRITSPPDLLQKNVNILPQNGLPVFVYQCVEGHAVPPAGGEIVNVDIGVPGEDEAQEKTTELPPWKLSQCLKPTPNQSAMLHRSDY